MGSAPAYYEALELEICLATGERHLVGTPPQVVSWSLELVNMLRANPGEWATVSRHGDHEIITLHVKPEIVEYRLTGEMDGPYELVGELIEP